MPPKGKSKQSVQKIQQSITFIALLLVVTPNYLKINDNKYPINIEFFNNEYKVCQNKQNDAWIKELFDNPFEYNRYEIEYQGQTYLVLAETLLTLMVYHFKKRLKGIINKFEFIVPQGTDPQVLHRIKSALAAIKIPNAFTKMKDNYMMRPREDFYEEQDAIINEMITKNEEYERRKREYKRIIKRIKASDSRVNKIQNYNEWYSTEKYQQWKMNYRFNEREELKLCHLDSNCLFLASMWLSSITDFKNLEYATKRAQYNSEKFTTNPIAMTPQIRKVFPNVNTLSLYKDVDYRFEDDESITDRDKIYIMQYVKKKHYKKN